LMFSCPNGERRAHPRIRAYLGSERAVAAFSNRQATRTAWGEKVAPARENQGD
jgi:hypothetical protein